MTAQPRVVREVAAMQQLADQARRAGQKIAVVPTMGALHDGHLSLVRLGREHADLVVLTIFVNPTQFGPGEDFSRYPRSLDEDIVLAGKAGADVIFAPPDEAVYPPGYLTYVHVEKITDVLEGKVRPKHFRGVATIVTKLFQMTKPHVAVFGQKDAQQVAVVRRLMADLNFDIELIVAPTVRESDGLAKSSRNVYLSATQRAEASVLYRSLQHAVRLIGEGARASGAIIGEMRAMIERDSSGVVDYISIADGSTLEEVADASSRRPLLISLAVRFGTTRLIDNVIVE